MPEMPTVAEVLTELDELAKSQYSKAARARASAWATPRLIEADATLVTEPPGLGGALFLLGAADLLAKPDAYLYQAMDFDEARREMLASDSEPKDQ
jgi:hypothetical protein